MSRREFLAMPFQEYRELPYLNQSSLKNIFISPQNFKICQEVEAKQTPSMRLGSVVHSYLEHKDLSKFAVNPYQGKRKITGEMQAHLDELQQTCEIVDKKTYELLARLEKTFSQHPQAKKLLNASESEVTGLGKIRGIQCKARFDLVERSIPIITDIKTTKCTSKLAFERDLIQYQVPFQMAFYQEIYRDITAELPRMAILAIENVAPWEVSLYFCDETLLSFGMKKLYEAFDIYESCLAEDSWPMKQSLGKGEMISIPQYLQKEI